jgi:hypothetical protein
MLLSLIVWGVLLTGQADAYEIELGERLTMDIHGFLSQGYLKSDSNNFLAETEDGTFEFREYGLNVSSYLTDQIYVGAQLFGRDFGDYGNNEPTLDWGFVGYHFQDWLGIRAGRMKIMYGLYNDVRDIDLVRNSIFLPESIYNDSWRDSFIALDGVGIYGTLSFESLGSFSYQAKWGKIGIESDSGFEKYLYEFFPRDVNEVEDTDIYVLGIEWNLAPPLDGLRLRWTWNTWELDDEGISLNHPVWQAQGIPPGLPMYYHGDFEVYVLSAELRWRDLVLTAETFAPLNYAYRLDMLNPMDGSLITLTSGADNDPIGYYGGFSYRVTDWFEIGTYYSEYYYKHNDKDGRNMERDTGRARHNAWLKDLSLTSRFDIGENWIIKVEGHLMDGTDIMLDSDNPDGEKQEWFLFGGKMTYTF